MARLRGYIRPHSPPAAEAKGMYRFGNSSNTTDSYRPGQIANPPPPRPPVGVDQYRPNSHPGGQRIRPGDFSFRASVPDQPSFSRPPAGPRAQRNRPPPGPSVGRRQGGSSRKKTSQRDLLSGHRQSTPEQLEGMGNSSSKYNAAEANKAIEVIELDKDSDEEDKQPPPKRRATTKNEDIAKPKWSNPDPYSGLAIEVDENAKHPDYVKLIRQARETTGQSGPQGDGSDFIAFGSDVNGDHSEEGQVSSDSHAPSLRREQQQQQFTFRSGPPVASHHIRGVASNGSFAPPPPTQKGHPPANALLYPMPNRTDQPPPTPSWPRSNPDVKAKARVPSRWLPAPAASAPQQPAQVRPQQAAAGRGKKRGHDEISERDPYGANSSLRGRDSFLLPKWASGSDRPWLSWIPTLPPVQDKMQQMHIEATELFYEYLQPRPFEDQARQGVIQKLQAFFDRHFPRCIARAFGSFAAGLYLPTADMDIVIMTKQFEERGQEMFGAKKKQTSLYKVLNKFQMANLSRGRPMGILGARVPLIKYHDKDTNLQVDISFENTSGLITIETYQEWYERYPELSPLVALVKLYLNMREFDDPSQGGIGGFTVTCLAVYLIHNWDEVSDGKSAAADNLGMLLYRFFDFYGHRERFDLLTMEINMGTMRIERKQSMSPTLVIKDPDNERNNIAKASKNAGIIFNAFQDAYNRLRYRFHEAEDLQKQNQQISILDVLYTGNYSMFNEQRMLLRRIAGQ